MQVRCNRHRFDPWVRKIPWRRAWQPSPVFLPGESHGLRSMVVQSIARSWIWLKWLSAHDDMSQFLITNLYLSFYLSLSLSHWFCFSEELLTSQFRGQRIFQDKFMRRITKKDSRKAERVAARWNAWASLPSSRHMSPCKGQVIPWGSSLGSGHSVCG